MLGLAATAQLGCTHFSPFEIDLPEAERDLTSKQLRALAARPSPDGTWRFAVVSDTHLGYDNLSAIVRTLNDRRDIEMVLVPGDMTDLGLREEYRTTLAILSKLRMPFVTTIGNHDAISNGKDLYTTMFGPFDYLLEWGGIKFVLYNNNALEFANDVPDMSWLERQISCPRDEARGVVVVAHIPPTRDQRQRLAHHGVLASIGGHIHRTELTNDPLPVFLAPHGAAGRFAIVEVIGQELAFSSCEGSSCEPVEA